MSAYERLVVNVGDTVTIKQYSYRNTRTDSVARTSEEIVTRVGRKYIYVSPYNREVAYAIEGGFGKSQYDGRAFTPDSYAAHQRRVAADAKLRQLTRNYSWIDHLSVEQIEAVVEILEQS